MKLGDTFTVQTAASLVLEQHHARGFQNRQKFCGKVVWIHPAGRFAVLDFWRIPGMLFPGRFGKEQYIMLNTITIMGRLTRDPELRKTASGLPVVSFTVAVDRDYSQNGNKEVDFIDCVAWRNTADFVCRYFVKGQMIALRGRLQIRDWNDKEGNKRRSAEVVADSCYFTGGKNQTEKKEDFPILPDDGENLPFTT